jgi:hypothetical protein
MLGLYRCLLHFYPASYRQEFGEEMTAVFVEAQAHTAQKGAAAQAAFCARETAGLLFGAIQERVRVPAGVEINLPFSTRRFTMRTEFRFPKSTAVLMTIILAGIVLAIEKAKAIQASLPDVNPRLGAIQPAHFTFLPTVALGFLFFYAAGLIGWAILFTLHRSGVHRLADMAGENK